MSPLPVNPATMSPAASRMADRLWSLLPEIHRQRDAEGSAPGTLRVLVEVLAEQASVVSDDLAQLYENLFIETCQAWVVPYLGDLVAAQPCTTSGSRPPPHEHGWRTRSATGNGRGPWPRSRPWRGT